jgi:hypothetical protein
VPNIKGTLSVSTRGIDRGASWERLATISIQSAKIENHGIRFIS